MQKWHKVKVVKYAILNTMAIFTGFVNVHVMIELQEELQVRCHNHNYFFDNLDFIDFLLNIIFILIL